MLLSSTLVVVINYESGSGLVVWFHTVGQVWTLAAAVAWKDLDGERTPRARQNTKVAAVLRRNP